MKTGTLSTKLMLAAILLTVVVYFGINMAAYFTDPYTTTIAYAYTSDNAVSVSGYVVREEEVLSGSGDLVYSSRSEGERVSAGGTVALIYQNAQALADANTVRSLEAQLEQLLYARTLVSSTQTSVRLDEEITNSLIAFRGAMAAGSLSTAGETGQALRANVLKRSYAYTGAGYLNESIASLQEQISALAASADPNTTRISAPRAGLFSSLVDGYESVLLPSQITSLTPSSYGSIAPAGSSGSIGKMIYGNSWSFVTVMNTADISRMQVGDTVTLRFQKGLDRDLPVQVSYISEEENGQRVVSFSSERYLNLTTLLRHQNAQIIFHSYTGIRVPRSAVRVISKPVTDEDGQTVLGSSGQPQTVSLTVVYSLWGNTAREKPVEVLWQEEDYLLVVPSEEQLQVYTTEINREGRRLRAGDEVITAAADIYDGKVIRS